MTKEQLRNYRNIKREYRQIEQRLRHLESRPESEEEILRPLRECYRAKLSELVQAQLRIEHAIERLNSFERQLVRLKYIDNLPWFRVASRLNYSEPQAKRIGGRILKKLEKM
jgi:DNA-directed RNA polymerase specialized sigma24 family protein